MSETTQRQSRSLVDQALKRLIFRGARPLLGYYLGLEFKKRVVSLQHFIFHCGYIVGTLWVQGGNTSSHSLSHEDPNMTPLAKHFLTRYHSSALLFEFLKFRYKYAHLPSASPPPRLRLVRVSGVRWFVVGLWRRVCSGVRVWSGHWRVTSVGGVGFVF